MLPYLQNDNSHNPENYWPVYMTSVICKIQERTICSNIMDHLERCGILCDDEHGFHSGLSTQTQLLTATHDWVEVLDWGGQTVSRLFYCVWQCTTLETSGKKWCFNGIDGKHNSLIRSLLHSHTKEWSLMAPHHLGPLLTLECPNGQSLGLSCSRST